MKLQRSTIVLVAVALLLGGVVLLTQTRQAAGPNRSRLAQGETEAAPVFGFEEAEVVELQIETQSQAVTFERDEAGFWQMTEPENQPAEEAAIAFLLSRLTTDGLLQTTTIDAANQAEFGLDVPLATVALMLADGTTHDLVLGDPDFSGQNYYALIDPEAIPLSAEAGEVEAAIVSENVFNGIDRPLEEWQAVVDEASPTETDEAETSDNGSPDAETDATDNGNTDIDSSSNDAETEDN